MPKITTDKLIKKIRNFNKNIPIILCSEYRKLLFTDQIKNLEINDFIEKPLHEKNDILSIRKVLNMK